MQQAFLIIIALAGAAYAFVTRQGKIGLGLIILSSSTALTFPNIVSGAWVDVFGALALILFLVGVIVVVYKKPEQKNERPGENNDAKTE